MDLNGRMIEIEKHRSTTIPGKLVNDFPVEMLKNFCQKKSKDKKLLARIVLDTGRGFQVLNNAP
jgi:hypothetical protein